MNVYPTKQLALKLDEILSEINKYNITLKNRSLVIEKKPINVIFIDITVRLVSHLTLLSILLENIVDDSQLLWLEHSIGICLRSALHDRILFNEIMDDLNKVNGWGNVEIEKELYIKHSSDQLKGMLDTLTKIEKGDKLFNSEIDTAAVKKFLTENFPDFFSNPAELKLKVDKQKSVRVATINTRQSDLIQEDALGIYELWDYYSKYEHYGPLSSIMLNQNPKTNWNRIVASIMNIVNTFVLLLSTTEMSINSAPILIEKIADLNKLKIKV